MKKKTKEKLVKKVKVEKDYKIKKQVEVYVFKKYDIKIGVKVDYAFRTISLIDIATRRDKQWLFAGRDLDFMGGWFNILEAMKGAIEDAKKRLIKEENSMQDIFRC